MKKIKIILLFITLLFSLFLIFSFAKAAEEKPEGRALEIVYPQIPGAVTPKTVASGLPEYIDYIFRFSVILIGLVILGAFIYSGFQYFTSFGSPEKLTTAKQGITAALLGAVILLSAYLIFNTINPQLTILEATPPDVIEPVVTDGIYLCNYKVPDNFISLLKQYQGEDKNQRIEAAKKLKEVMQNKNGSCFRVNYSTNLANFVFDWKRHDAFAIPREEYVYTPATETEPAKTDIKWVYDYGIIFHEKDNFMGECAIGTIYDIVTYPIFKARSVTIFRKPAAEPYPESEGVILYECLAYNKGGTALCPSNITGNVLRGSFGTGGADYNKFSKKELSTPAADVKNRFLAENTRSIQIDPVGYYFAILFSEDGFKGETCEVISKNDNNLLDQPIGRCGDCSFWFWQKETTERQLNKCLPCLKSMYVIKGKVL